MFLSSFPYVVSVAYCRASLRLQRTVVNLNLWDTAGQERFRAVNSLVSDSNAASHRAR